MAPRQALSLLVIALHVMTVVNSSAGVTKRGISKSDDSKELKGALQVYEDNLNKGEDNMLQKGHMNPSLLNSFNIDYMTNTFRLSNAAPQYKTSNFGDWYIYEKWLAKYTKEECATKFKGIMYIITGTSNNYIGKTPNPEAPAAIEATEGKKPSTNLEVIFQQKMQKALGKPVTFPKIAIPRSIWTVACCVSQQGVESMAVMTNNHWLKDQLQQTEMAVQLLAKKLGTNVNFFPKLPACSNEKYTVVLGSMYK